MVVHFDDHAERIRPLLFAQTLFSADPLHNPAACPLLQSRLYATTKSGTGS